MRQARRSSAEDAENTQEGVKPVTDALSNNVKLFDIALSHNDNGTLFAFAATFTDRITAPFLYWPDWMVTHPETGSFLNFGNFAFESFKIAVNIWSGTMPEGKIKFNLEGLDSILPDGSVHTITLKELKYIDSPEGSHLKLRTRFFEYEFGAPAAQELDPIKAEKLPKSEDYLGGYRMSWDNIIDLYNRASKVERHSEYAQEMLKLIEHLRNDSRFSEVSVSNAYLNLVFEIPAKEIRVNVFREDTGTYCVFVEGCEESTRVSVDLPNVKAQIINYLEHNEK